MMAENSLVLTLDTPGAVDAIADCIAQPRVWARDARAEQYEAVTGDRDRDTAPAVVSQDSSDAPEPVSQAHSDAPTSDADRSQRLVHATPEIQVAQEEAVIQ